MQNTRDRRAKSTQLCSPHEEGELGIVAKEDIIAQEARYIPHPSHTQFKREQGERGLFIHFHF